MSRSRSLQRRILVLVAIGIVMLIATLGLASWLAVRASIDRLLHERMVLAQATADHLERALHLGLRRLGEDVGPTYDPSDGLEAEREAASRASWESIFGDGVFLLDAAGRPLLHVPPGTRTVDPSTLGEPLRDALAGRPTVSNVVVLGSSGRKVVAGLEPLRGRDGSVTGVVGGGIDLTGTRLRELIQTRILDAEQSIEILDATGMVLATTRSDQLFHEADHRHFVADHIRDRRSAVVECHGCHEKRERETFDVMALAPLESIPWAVAIREDRAAVLQPAIRLRDALLVIGVVFLLGAAIVATITVRSVVRPITILTQHVRGLARGELDTTVPALGDDEIGELARHTETMRLRLRDSLQEIRRWNVELEEKVARRTTELRASASQNEALYRAVQKEQEGRKKLLHKVIGAQEDERKRVARELHDSTCQELAALALRLDAVSADDPRLTDRMAPIKALARDTIDGVHRLMFDLRPAMLDDLGLASALRWLLGHQFEHTEIQARMEIEGDERRLPPELETTLFRLAQEATTNVARHAHASQVLVTLTYDSDGVALEIEDDGVGFDPASIARGPTTADSLRGLGLLGMRERVALWEGTLDFDSAPDEGTRVRIFVPRAVAVPPATAAAAPSAHPEAPAKTKDPAP